MSGGSVATLVLMALLAQGSPSLWRCSWAPISDRRCAPREQPADGQGGRHRRRADGRARPRRVERAHRVVGALFAQYQGFANIQMGIGAIVTGLANLMVGETLLGRRPIGRWIAGAVVGAVVFRLIVAAAIRAGLNPNALKLVTALFVLAVLVLPHVAARRSG